MPFPNILTSQSYINDIIVWSAMVGEHLEHPVAVFDRLRETNLKVHTGKCIFWVESIGFLGHHISAGSLQPQQDKLVVVRDLSFPTTVSGLQLALGLFLYYRKFVNHFSTSTFLLCKPLKKAKRWLWGEE